MKFYLILITLLFNINTSKCQNNLQKTNPIDEFAKKYSLNTDISTISRNVELTCGSYQSNGDYLSFLMPFEKDFFGIKTKFVWYRFTNNKLTNLALVFDPKDTSKILPEIMALFDGYNKKDAVNNLSYWKGNIYNAYFQLIKDDARAFIISTDKDWPIYKQL